MAVFGVDFGNFSSTVSTARRGGVDILVNEVSKRETGSMVGFGNKQRGLGEKAVDQAIRNWKNTVGNLKRLLGVHYDSEAGRQERRFNKLKMRADANGLIEVQMNYKWEDHWFKPEQLIAMLFTQLRSYPELEAALEAKVAPGKVKVTDCVVSVPIYYSMAQRNLLIQSLQIAGLTPLTLINETTAAALDWGIFKSSSLPEDEKDAIVVLIVDFGHSATTASVVSFMKGQLKVLGHVFDQTLGCRALDASLYDHFSKEVETKYKCDLSENKKHELKLMLALEKMRKMLSANAVAPLNCEMSDFDVQIPIVTRESCEELWAPEMTKLRSLLARAVALPGGDRISTVELIGGGTRIPFVKSTICEVFSKVSVQQTLNASESIAKGCGIMGAMLSPKFRVKEFQVTDCNVYSVNLGYYSDKAQNPIVDPNFPQINKSMVVLKPGDACPKILNLSFERSQEFELYMFYEACDAIAYIGPDLLIGKWKIAEIPTIAEQPPTKVRLRINPSMIIKIEGASVTEEWEEEETIEVPKEKKEDKKEEKSQNGTTDGPAPMETDEASPPKEEKDSKKQKGKEKTPPPEVEKKKVMKKKTKKHDCSVVCLESSGNTENQVKDYKDAEEQMARSDANVHETQECKNNLETYIYETRSKVGSGGMYAEYITAVDSDALMAALTDVEDWLYQDGEDAAKEDYMGKLADLKKLGQPPVQRYNDRMALSPAVLAFTKKATELRTQAENAEGKLGHIPADELQSVIAKCNEIAQFVQSEVACCDALPKHQALTCTASVIQTKQKELTDFATPILSKPKPKEEKKEEPKPTESNGTDGPTEEKKAENKMDLD
eukprot:NODE_236_length_2621_cov_181.063352_g221_i0.p1 GENE.NODE_236_length_2621_cov_181.063352_g221_i0~~NODE_236_length_2621_cov_181.063352_g221_i0.p1  ORF type:complete len:834 (-),score=282.09 NODE_236_length_2621_cov_181.063352_g221_i0:75-2576(-)